MNKWQSEVQKSLLKSEDAALKEIEKQYSIALKDIMDQVKRFESDIQMIDDALMMDNLDDAAKQRLLSMKQSKIYQKQYQQALQGQISGILDKLHGDNYKSINTYLKDSYDDAFVGTMYDIAQQGIPIIQPIDQAAVVRAVLTDSKVSNGLYTALGVEVKGLKKKITQEISRGISTGMSYADIARNLANVSKAPQSRTKTIVRTEGHRIQQAATKDAQYAAKDRGADIVKQWDASLDQRTRPTHQILDGQIRELDEPFEVNGKQADRPGYFGIPGEDINCRCVCLTRARWALDEDELQILKDRAAYYGLEKENEFERFKKQYLNVADNVAVERQRAFAPAKTIEEAEEYAQRFVSTYKSKYSGNVSFKGMDVEQANKVNKLLTDIFDSYDIDPLGNLTTMNFRESKWKTAVEDGIAGAYQWGGNGGTLFMNQKIFANSKALNAFTKKADDLLQTVLGGIDSLIASKESNSKMLKYLEALKKSKIQVVAQKFGDFTETTFAHEAGHMLDDKLFRQLFKKSGFDLSASMAKYAASISGYAQSSSAEYVAESFASFWFGETEFLDPELITIFKDAAKLTAKGIESGADDGIISSVKSFARGSKDFQTVFLPKKEYAHVMSEIATHLTDEQASKTVFRKLIGQYAYTVENNGFGNYRIIGKELIDPDKFE